MNYNYIQNNRNFRLPEIMESQQENLQDNNINSSEQILLNLKSKLNHLKKENSCLLIEIDEMEALMSTTVEENLKILEEAVETKTQLSLLKKNIETKRSYLDFLMKVNKKKSEETQVDKTEKIKDIVNKINLLTQSINRKNSEACGLRDFSVEIESLLK
jgi:hypothetical protein